MAKRTCVNCGGEIEVAAFFGYVDDECPHCTLSWERPVEPELVKETDNWSLPSIVRVYKASDAGRHRLSIEAKLLGQHGYLPSTQSEGGGHIDVGRVLLMGAWSVLGPARAAGDITVTFAKQFQAARSSDDPADLLMKLAQLRDAGILTAEEFEAKKRQVLERA